ncbi:hypothetical protein [Enterococcus casseliflavus]|uniref:hypothetical protein n=1 Tax=Enterococcus casseliflavus TaxID=37734 RepID=UPI00115DD0AD|nr:hypothetical protein [Enterococcus casseliflavus]
MPVPIKNMLAYSKLQKAIAKLEKVEKVDPVNQPAAEAFEIIMDVYSLAAELAVDVLEIQQKNGWYNPTKDKV